MAGHSAPSDIDMCAPTGLIRKHDAQAVHRGLVVSFVRAHDAGQVVGVGHSNGALARSDGLDLVGVTPFGCSGHVDDQTLKPSLRLGFTQVLHDGAKQGQVVRVGA